MVIGEEYAQDNSTSTESTQHQQHHHHVHEDQSFLDEVSQYVMKFFGNILSDHCRAAYSFYHFYFHIGCGFFLLAFLATSQRYGSALYMRCMFTFGCVLFLMYSYMVECHPDVLIWTLAFIVINLIHMILLISKLRPVKFEKEIEEVSYNLSILRHISDYFIAKSLRVEIPFILHLPLLRTQSGIKIGAEAIKKEKNYFYRFSYRTHELGERKEAWRITQSTLKSPQSSFSLCFICTL
jgi:hypothetical protein